MDNLKDVVVVITGAASGMGAATAKTLAAKGAKIALLDINIDKAITLAEEINGYAITCDVSDAESSEKALMQVIEKLGPVRICVNCAGIAPAQRVVGRDGVMPLANFQKAIEINLIGSFNILRLAAAQMCEQQPVNSDGERGLIINTASVAAFDGQIGQAAYSASKAGIVGMTLPLARELARFGIRVMTIAPGIIATPMMSGMPDNVQESLANMIPFPKRLGQASEFAKLCLHIIENPYLNGEVIRLDGAIRMQAK
ncbi:MAG: SDR family NAD(P)-dependent oxidoreductase [Pseudomonadota bacterium]